MAERSGEIKQFQKRLDDAFSYKEILGGRFLLPAIDMEREVGEQFVHKYYGHRKLTDSFLDFFGETLSSQADYNYKFGWPTEKYYVTCLMMFVTMFRSTRSAELLSTNAYPMQGYAVMRSVRDQAWVLCAAASGMATFGELFGWEGANGEILSAEDQERVVGNRRKIEGFIRAQLIGKRSGLSEEAQFELLRWDRMFNQEAHRGLFTLFRSSQNLMDSKGPRFSLVPQSDEILDGMFLNRSTEINWMILRLLPFVRRKETYYDGWAEKWKLLDESFVFMYRGLAEMGKKIAPAFVEMMDTKFKFDPTMFFFEPTPKPKTPPSDAPQPRDFD